jgi:hypothetical protein
MIPELFDRRLKGRQGLRRKSMSIQLDFVKVLNMFPAGGLENGKAESGTRPGCRSVPGAAKVFQFGERELAGVGFIVFSHILMAAAVER